MFEVLSYKKRFDANKVTLVENGGHPYIVRQGSDNGQKGFIDEDEIYLNDGNTISFGQDTATMFYQEKPYFTGDKIKILKPKMERFGKDNAQFFLATMRRSFSNFGWGTSSFSIEVIENQNITLPTTANNEIDFDFMESFIRELEEERVRELQSYLAVTGLSDYTLTLSEQDALKGFETLEWREFRYDEIFNHIEQGRRLKKDDQKAGNIPFVMSGVTNTGVVNYISNPVASFPANSLTVDIFGNTFYRSFAYGLGDDTGAYWSDEKEYSKEEMLFFTAAIGKSLAGKYSYGHKLRSSQSLGFKMLLPVRDGAPDYAAMQDFISAVQKLVIKDVVKYAEDKINATKKVVKNKDEYKTTEDKSFLLVAESADYKGIPR